MRKNNNRLGLGTYIPLVLIVIVLLFLSFALFQPTLTGSAVFSDNNFFGIGKPDEYNFNLEVKDSNGENLDLTYELIDVQYDNVKYVKEIESLGGLSNLRKESFKVKKGKYDVKIKPKNGPIKEILIKNKNINSHKDEFLGIDDVPEFDDLVEVYAIDPTKLDFTEATVTVNATGTKLYKCKGWNFKSRICEGEWELIKSDLVPGEEYSFILTPEDPGYAETGIKLEMWDQTDSGYPFGGHSAFNSSPVNFYANFSSYSDGICNPINGGICAIYFNNSNGLMNYNSSTTLYHYENTFDQPGVYDWNVTCFSNEGCCALSANDTVVINSSEDLGEDPIITDICYENVSVTYAVYDKLCSDINSLTIELIPDINSSRIVSVYDKDNFMFDVNITPENKTFFVDVSGYGNELILVVNGESYEENIHISCSQPIGEGFIFDEFLIVEADLVIDPTKVKTSEITSKDGSYVEVDKNKLFYVVFNSSLNNNDTIFMYLLDKDAADIYLCNAHEKNCASPGYGLVYSDGSEGWLNITISNLTTSKDRFNIDPGPKIRFDYIYSQKAVVCSSEDKIPPIITLIKPPHNSYDNNGLVKFRYNVTDESEISGCKVVVNDTVMQSSSIIERNIMQILTVGGLTDRTYSWYINCTDIYGNEGSSETRIIYVDIPDGGDLILINETINSANDDKVTAKVEYIDCGSNEIDYQLYGSVRSGMIYPGTYTIKITPENISIYEVLIVCADIVEPVNKLIDIDNPDKPESFISAIYALDPSKTNFTFEYINVSLTATGRNLYKCPNWNYSGQICTDNRWKRIMSVIPGENYTFTIYNSSDPGYQEDDRTINVLDKDEYLINNSQEIINQTDSIETVNITYVDHVIENMIVYDHNLSSYIDDLYLDDLTDNQNFTELYAIDPTKLDFKEADITVTATNETEALLKCDSWNFTTQNCTDDDWAPHLRSVIPNDNYNLIVNYTDPGYAECQHAPDNISDSYLKESKSEDNHGLSHKIRVGKKGANKRYRGIVSFNLSYLPPAAQVTNATLRLYVFKTQDIGSGTIHSLHKVQQSPVRDWEEYEVSWDKYKDYNDWTTGGGDFNSTITNSAILNSSSEGTYVYFSVTSDVQDFVSNLSTNFGWIIKDLSESTNARVDYRSSEHNTQSQWPTLVVDYVLETEDPIVNLINPEDYDAYVDEIIPFEYEVTDNSSISNCKLFIDDVLNQTNTSINVNSTNYFYLDATTLQDGNYNWSVSCTDQYNNIGYSETLNFIKNSTYVCLSEFINDAAGSGIQSYIELILESDQSIRYNKSRDSHTTNIPPGVYTIVIYPYSGPIANVTINSFNISQDVDQLIDLDLPNEVTTSPPIGFNFREVYVVNPQQNVVGEVSILAKGNEIFKCSDWIFEWQVCQGEWVNILNTTPGSYYTVPFNGTDPAYGESSDYFTLRTIDIDGDTNEWGHVLNNANNYVSDGTQGIDDADTGQTADRDLRLYAFTWDDDYLYSYFKRTASGNRRVTMVMYIDIDNNGLLESSDYLLKYRWIKNGEWTSYLYNYIPSNAFNISTEQILESGVLGADENNIELETRINWSYLGITPGSPIQMHVAATRGAGEDLPNDIEDNVGAVSTLIADVDIEPNRESSGNNNQTVYYNHTITNTGNDDDTVNVQTVGTTLGFIVNLTYANRTQLIDTNNDTKVDVGILSPGESVNITLAITIIGAANGDLDETYIIVTSATDPGNSDNVFDITSIGDIAIYPSRSGRIINGSTITFDHTVANNLVGYNVIDINATSNNSYVVNVTYANGTYLTDTDNNSLIDIGNVSQGTFTDILVKVQIPGSASIDSKDITTIEGIVDDISLTCCIQDITTVSVPIKILPNRVGFISVTGEIFYDHTVFNNLNVTDVGDLSYLSSRDWDIVLLDQDRLTELNDSDSDGIIDTGNILPFGERKYISANIHVGETLVPDDTFDQTNITVNSSGFVGAYDYVTDNTTARIMLTYEDAAFTTFSELFNTSQIVYANSYGLSDHNQVYYIWYDSFGVLVRQSPPITVDANDEADDQLQLNSSLPYSTYTVYLYNNGEITHEFFDVYDAPNIHVLNPDGGESWSGNKIINYNVSDFSEESITTTIQYSSNNGISFNNITTLQLNATPYNISNETYYKVEGQFNYTWDTTSVSDGIEYLIRVIGDNTYFAGSDSSDAVFTIDNSQPPIFDENETTPSGGEEFNQTDNITITVCVSENVTAIGNVVWDSTSQNFTMVFNGTEWCYEYVWTNTTWPGDYNLTFNATDPEGNTNTTSTNFTINDVTPPNVVIIAPPPGSNYTQGATVPIQVNVTDPYFDNMGTVVANITWDSTYKEVNLVYNVSSMYWEGTFVNTTHVDTYTITIIAEDDANNINDSETTSFTITDNFPPTFNESTIVPGGDEFNQTDNITFGVCVNENSTITADVEWDSTSQEVTMIFNGTEWCYEYVWTNTTWPGGYNLTFNATDPEGNSNTTSTNFTITDVTPPNVVIIAPLPGSNYTQGATVPIQVNVTDPYFDNMGAVVANITWDATYEKVNLVYNATSSYWEGTFTNTTDIDAYTLSAVTTDNASNVNDSETTSFNIQDVTPPTFDENETQPSGGEEFNQTENVTIKVCVNENVTAVGNAVWDSTSQNFTMVFNGTEWCYDYVFTNTTWPGGYNITINITDPNNNTNTPLTHFTIIDVTPPTVIILTPTNGNNYSQGSDVSITVNVTDPYFDNMGTVTANITWDATYEEVPLIFNLTTGLWEDTFTNTTSVDTYNLTIIATDNDNNINDSETTSFTIQDTTPPTFNESTIEPSGDIINQTENITFVACVSENSTLTVDVVWDTTSELVNLVYNGTPWCYEYVWTNTTWPGQYNITFNATDPYNNSNTTPTNFTVVDVTYPTVNLNNPTDIQLFISTNNITFDVSATDNYALNNCTLWTNISGTWQENETKTFTGVSDSETWNLNNLDNGSYNWNAYCCDSSNNCAWETSNYTFTIAYNSGVLPDKDFTYLITNEITTIYGYMNGTLNYTYYNYLINAIQLNVTNNGSYTSQVFDVGEESGWDNISWISPKIGELPDNKQIETYGANMTDNLLLMHLDESSGTIVDSSGEGNDGTYNGELWLETGKFDTALSFDGTNDFIDTTLTDNLSSGPFSVFVWIKNVPAGNSFVVSQAQQLSPYVGDWVLGNENGGLWFRNQTIDGNNITSDGGWHHSGFVFNGTTADLYIDSQYIGSIIPINVGSNNPVKLMTRGDGTTYFTSGTLDEVAIWNRTLSISEINHLYERGVTRLNISVKDCDDILCLGETWTDIVDSSPQNLSLADNQYFQYKFEFESEDLNFSQKLYNVTIHYSDILPPEFNESTIEPVGDEINQTENITFKVCVNDNSTLTADVEWDSTSQEVSMIFNGTEWCYGYVWTNTTHPGGYNVTFNATDPNGNSNTTSTNFTVIDVTLPSVTIVTPIGGTNYSQGSSIPIIVNVTDSYFDNMGTVIANFTWDATYEEVNLTFNSTTELWDGYFTNTNEIDTYNLTIIATDNSGNVNDTETTYFTTIDNNPPVFNESTIKPNGESYNQNDTVTFVACVNENSTLITNVGWDATSGSATLVYNGTEWCYEYVWTNTSWPGNYNITFNATDPEGNSNTTTTTFTVSDVTAPLVDIITPANGSNYPQNSTIFINVNVTDPYFSNMYAVIVDISWDATFEEITLNYNSTSGFWEGNFTDTSSVDTYVLTVIAIDNAFNFNASETSTFFIVSNVPPTFNESTIKPQNDTINQTDNITFVACVSENVTLTADVGWDSTSQEVTMIFNGTEWCYDYVWTNTTYPGGYNITFNATDPEGESNTTSTTFTVADVTPPSVTIITPSEGNNYSQGSSIPIQVNVTDPYFNNIGTVIVNITWDSTYEEVPLVYNGTSTFWEGFFTNTSDVDIYNLTVIVIDNNSNMNDSEIVTFKIITNITENNTVGDFGDAPDSTNHYATSMTAYPKGGPLGTLANFPTVFDIATGTPPGPCHNETYLWVWLGNNISVEKDADQLPDNDNNITNLNVTVDSPDLDWYDDGLDMTSINMTNCTYTNFTFNISVNNNILPIWGNYSFNAWFDWDRDGDWNDTFTCTLPGDAPEWAVQNQNVYVGGQLGPYPAILTFTTTAFLPYNAELNETWMRMTLEPVGDMNSDGSGPGYCYEDGETEDYYLNVSEVPPEDIVIDSPNITIVLNPGDNSSSDINWTNVTGADSYTIYYSANLCNLINLNLSNIPAGVYNVSGLTSLNWTDYNSSDDQTRYYRVSAVSGSEENLSDAILGKHTHYLKGTPLGTNDHNRKNFVSLSFDYMTDAETFVQNVPGDKGIRVVELSRSDNDTYSYVTHNKGGPNNFTMNVGGGYQIEVSDDINYTLVGFAITDDIYYDLYGISTGFNDVKRKNWVGAKGCNVNANDAETFIQNVPDGKGIRVIRLNRPDSITYSYITHNKGGPNNFTMYVGEGYEVEVSDNVNYTYS